jgi:ribokinase
LSFDVVVVGSINHDLTVLSPHHPMPGETVLGSGHFTGAGGKGANQAVAAARHGVRVAMVGLVGADAEGEALRLSMSEAGVDVSGVGVSADEPTGLAVITVDSTGQNSIVVSPGANRAVDQALVHRHAAVVSGARVALVQLEIPVEAVAAAARISEGIFILNAAPARDLPPELLKRIDVLVVNRSELAHFTGSEDPSSLGRIKGPRAVVVTVGDEGAVFSDDSAIHHCLAPAVEVVDTTGAGDAFCGALAASLARGQSLAQAVPRAVVSGSLATTRAGAQASMPNADEVDAAVVSLPPPVRL